jgi:hypothetical protein
VCNGGNPGCYRDTNFLKCFANGLVVGDASKFSITFTTSAAVVAFPQGGPSVPLSADYTNPTATLGNLASQMMALNLNVDFDSCRKPSVTKFSSEVSLLGNQVYCGPEQPCSGKTVYAIQTLGNKVLGGAGMQNSKGKSTVVDDESVSYSDLNTCVSLINENYVDGDGKTNGNKLQKAC